jgi:hypothetical protein
METAMPRFYDLDDTVCFYKDTVNCADRKLVCIFHQEYTSAFYHEEYKDDAPRNLTYRLKNSASVPQKFMANNYCRIGIDKYRKQINYSLDDFAAESDYISLVDFLQTCEVETCKINIAIKMVALYRTSYSHFIIESLSNVLFGQSYRIRKTEY